MLVLKARKASIAVVPVCCNEGLLLWGGEAKAI